MIDLAEIEDRISKCNKLLDANPNSQIFAALAEAYRKKGDLDLAFRVCQSGLRIHPDYGSAHMVMARVNVDKGMYDWAEIEAKKTIDIEGNSHATDLLLAEIYINKNDMAQATKLLDELHKNDPANKQVLDLLEVAKKHEVSSAIEINEEPVQSDENVEQIVPENKEDLINHKELVDTLSEISGVEGALLINNDGMVAESRWIDNQGSDLFGALAKDIEQSIQTLMDSSVFGKYENLLIEGENLIINMVPIENCLLLIKANSQINLGTLKLRMNALLDKLDSSVSKSGVQS
ncbi:MAG: hypothetical protein GY865_18785 [candidate division Zixibacteria bacterium]|nr:hypothetical protein [candidate division Zixibacteria bacterium]